MKTFLLILVLSLASKSCNESKEQITLNNNWKVTSMQNTSSFEKNPTIQFDEKEKRISGFSGCNNYFGTYSIEKNNLSFSQMGSTRKMCLDMTVENTFMNNLRNVTHYKIEKGKLFLFNDKNVQIFICSIPK